MKRKVDFDWYCKTKKDVINNAAYELIVALTAKSAPPRKFELSIPQWDDLMIANIVENAINAIDERIGYYCHPFYRKKEDEVAKERRTKAEAEERAFCEEQNRLSEQAVQEAIRTIKDGGVLQNQTVKFYRSRYRCNAFSIVNYLMRKYGVNVPLRTQGWINEKLTSVTIENGKCEHLRYMRAKGAQCSQRFFDCMSELIHNVCAETEG